jgi:multiple sugar transport system substrate-binding protein
VALFLLLVPVISGCTNAQETSEPVTITFAYSAPDAGYYETLIEQFNEQHPGITVELVAEEDTASDETPPDVFIVAPFQFNDLLEQGAILSLDSLIAEDAFDLADLYPGSVNLCTYDGQLYALPAGLNMMVLYYNRDLFDTYAVPYPQSGWTWDDFLNDALAISHPDAGVFGYVINNQFIEPLAFVYQHGGRILDDMQNPTRTTFDDPLTIEAVDWYARLTYEYNVAPTRSQLFDEPFNSSPQAGVYAGKVGMWIDWLSSRGGGGGIETTWPGAWEMNWGMVPLPRDAQAATVAYALGYAISSQSAYPEASWQWITFLSEQGQAPYGTTPTRRSVLESSAYEQRVGGDVAEIARESIQNVSLLSRALFEFMNPYLYVQAIDRIVNGDSTAQEALSAAQRQAGQ